MGTASTNWILKLIDNVSSPARAIQSSITGASQQFYKLSENTRRYEKQASVLQGTLAGLSVSAGAFAALSYGSIQFGQGMARANTMAELGEKDLARYTNQVRNLAGVVPIVRKELTDGLYETISNGVPENNWTQFLTDSSRASVGGVADLKEVVGVTSTIIKNYNKDWTDAAIIQDKIQKTAKLGKTSFQELGSTLPSVTGLAAQLNIGMDELLGTFGALTGVSGNTSEVGTQINAIMSALIKPSSEAIKLSSSIGVQFDSNSIEKAGGLQPFFKILQAKVDAYAKTNNLNSTEIYGRLFGSQEALKAFLPLTSSVAQDFQGKTAQIANAAGTIDQAFEAMSNTSTAKFQIMRNKFGNMMDGIVNRMTPLVVRIFELTGGVFDMVRKFTDSNPVLTKFAIVGGVVSVGIYAMVTALALARVQTLLFTSRIATASIATWKFTKPLAVAGLNAMKAAGSFIFAGVSALGTFVGSMITATAAQWNLNIAMDANPIGLIIIGIAALITAVIAITKYYDEWGASILMLVGGSFGMLINTIVAISRQWDSITESFSNDGIVAGIKRIGIVILDAMLMPMEQFLNLVAKIPGMSNMAANAAGVIDRMRDNLGVNKDGWFDKFKLKNISGKQETSTMVTDALKYNPNALNSKGIEGNGLSVDGTGAGNKSLVMNLDIKNNFDVKEGADVDNIVDIIMERLVDRFRDAAIQFG